MKHGPLRHIGAILWGKKDKELALILNKQPPLAFFPRRKVKKEDRQSSLWSHATRETTVKYIQYLEMNWLPAYSQWGRLTIYFFSKQTRREVTFPYYISFIWKIKPQVAGVVAHKENAHLYRLRFLYRIISGQLKVCNTILGFIVNVPISTSVEC